MSDFYISNKLIINPQIFAFEKIWRKIIKTKENIRKNLRWGAYTVTPQNVLPSIHTSINIHVLDTGL